MRYLSLCILGFSFAAGTLSALPPSQPTPNKVCPCTNCTCTKDSHCGCFSNGKHSPTADQTSSGKKGYTCECDGGCGPNR